MARTIIPFTIRESLYTYEYLLHLSINICLCASIARSPRFVTQRTHPKLATIVPSVPREFLHLTPDVWPDAPAEAAVAFSSEWKDAEVLEPLRVPLNFHGKQAWKKVKIWEWEGRRARRIMLDRAGF